MTPTRSERVDPSRVAESWWRLWAMAAFAHVVTNAGGDTWTFESFANASAGIIAFVVLIRPDERLWRTALVVAIPISAFAEAPLLGNHWLLAAAVSLIALAARPWRPDIEFWARFAPSARVVLLVFYSFAAFAKLNTGFFDPVASCARYFTNRSLSFWQLPEISGTSPIATLLPLATAAIELSVPVLLLIPRVRRFGVLLGITFHLALTVDLLQHFFDFTLVLIPLFLLFANGEHLVRLDDAWPRLRAFGGWPWIVLAMYMVLASSLPMPVAVRGSGLIVSWGVWIVVGFILTRSLVRPLLRTDERTSTTTDQDSVSLRPVGIWAAIILALMFVNGLTPYLELKSATGFNMYANLSTVAGESNHLVVRRTIELRNDQSQLARIIATDNDDLEDYIEDDLRLPIANLRDYLAANPDTMISFEFDDEVITLDRAGDHPEWVTEQPWYLEKLLFFRAVSTDDVPGCQAAWLPAR